MGFDFLGYPITTTGLAPATQTQRNIVQRIAQLYEQGADIKPHWPIGSALVALAGQAA